MLCLQRGSTGKTLRWLFATSFTFSATIYDSTFFGKYLIFLLSKSPANQITAKRLAGNGIKITSLEFDFERISKLYFLASWGIIRRGQVTSQKYV